MERWLTLLETGFGDRILPVDIAIALEWSRMAASTDVSTMAGLIAATAKVNGLVLVANDRPRVEGVLYLNPFKPKG